MKTSKLLALLLLLVAGSLSSVAQTGKPAPGIEVVYFHATNRCITCEAVETVTREALKQYYGNQISFKSVNRDEDKANPLMKKHKVSGQTLLIIKGDKAENLTNFAFMNARTKPEKLKAKIKETIDRM